jgi:hypothetical protein
VKRVCLVNGSLRGKKAASSVFLTDLAHRLPDGHFQTTVVPVHAKARDRYPDGTMEALSAADAIVFVFPLHNYGMPGALMRLMEDWEGYRGRPGDEPSGAKVHLIVNCGYPRAADTCGEAIRVMHNYCRRLSLDWRFAVCIGTGPIVVVTRRLPLLYHALKRAYADIATDIQGGETRREDRFVKPVLPAPIIAGIKRHYEKKGQMIERPSLTLRSHAKA